MFDPCPGADDAPVARSISLANRLSGLALELDVGPPADLLDPALAGFEVNWPGVPAFTCNRRAVGRLFPHSGAAVLQSLPEL